MPWKGLWKLQSIRKRLMAILSNVSRPISPLKFFVLTFTLSWIIWIALTIVAPQISEGVSNVVRLFGVLMPAVSAIALTAYYSGHAGLRRLFSRFKIWRVGGKWWLAIVFIYPVMLVAAGLLYNLFNVQSPVNLLPISIVGFIANIIFLTIASMGEEIGWRGVAMPALQRRYSSLSSSTILGFFWAACHIPFWILIGTLSQYGPVYLSWISF